MGLFSFIKSAGAELFGASEKEEAEKAEKLTGLITKLKVPVENLSITVNDETATVSGEVSDVSTKEKIVLILGNAKGIASVEDNLTVAEDAEEEGETKYHTVVLGESLSMISKQYYGDAAKYPIIFEANKPMIKHPGQIYPGQVIRIPELIID